VNMGLTDLLLNLRIVPNTEWEDRKKRILIYLEKRRKRKTELTTHARRFASFFFAFAFLFGAVLCFAIRTLSSQ
jgi:hypothetical protein